MSFETIYRVFYRLPADDYNTVKQLGIYESQAAAKKAISMTVKVEKHMVVVGKLGRMQ